MEAGHQPSCAARGRGRRLAEATLLHRRLGLGQAVRGQGTIFALVSFERAEGAAASQGARSPLVGEERRHWVGEPHRAGEDSTPKGYTSLGAEGTAGEVVVVAATAEGENWAVQGVAFGPADLVLARCGHHFGFHEADEEVVDRTLVVEVGH